MATGDDRVALCVMKLCEGAPGAWELSVGITDAMKGSFPEEAMSSQTSKGSEETAAC
jgi:hypothetical protein